MSLSGKLAQMVNKNPFLRRLYDASQKILHVSFFYIVREGLTDDGRLNVKPKIDSWDVVFLKPSDIKDLSENPEVPESTDLLLERLTNGYLCIGIKHRGEIAAYMWCNLRECRERYVRFDLRKDEAYLMDARTFSLYRGKNLAPYLRVELYRHLRQMGRTKFISITDYWNTPASRFKKKLHAKPQKLFVWVKFLMKYERAVLLKRY
ncbi:MAG: GNAT family N-acetyltransferase [Deltaproteobacteria bacterium]|nr:GNAT family N-acetyltransferase [Deltaproteobacteria bacterium]